MDQLNNTPDRRFVWVLVVRSTTLHHLQYGKVGEPGVMLVIPSPPFSFHLFFLTLSEFTGFHLAWLLCQYLSHSTGGVQECRKMNTLIDNLLER